MQLTPHEQDLLRLYRADRRKKIKTIIFTIIAFIGASSGTIYAYKHRDMWLPSKEEYVIPDTTPPILILEKNHIEIEKGAKIDYQSYVKNVFDKHDEDVELTFNKIDTSKLGEHKIVYKATDKAGNTQISCVDVFVKEIKIEEDKPQETPTPPSSDDDWEYEEPSTPSVEETPTAPPPETSSPIYFLFSDGYTMDNVAEACGSELRSSGRAGVCSPIQDDDGIYLGMRLDFD